MIKAVLFDLDGTLLPMDNDNFTKVYFGLLAKKLAPYGYNPDELIAAIWKGTKAMIKNDGSRINEDVFWEVVQEIYGEKIIKDKHIFDEFYANEFDMAVSATGKNPFAPEAVKAAREKAQYVILATNPFFPVMAIRKRLGWIGLTPEDFDLITTYENSRGTKPNTIYYKNILDKFGVKPEEAIMIGNDVNEDIKAAGALGMEGYLVKDCIIGDASEVSADRQGSFKDMIEFVKAI